MPDALPTAIYLDSDSGLGSPAGDVDDAFAIAALIKSGIPIAALGSVFGNTREPLAAANNRALATVLGWAGRIVRGAERPGHGSEASEFLAGQGGEIRIAALGPLTNLADALRRNPAAGAKWKDVVCVGSNATSWGGLPPVWPMEFNLTQDRAAAGVLFARDCTVPMTVVPLDVACRLRVERKDLEGIRGTLGEVLRAGSERWSRRNRVRKLASSFAVWDLVAALVLIEPDLFQIEERAVRFHRWGWLQHGAGSRTVRVVTSFDAADVWTRFLQLVNS